MLSNFEKSNEKQFTTLSNVPKTEFLVVANFQDNDFIKESVTVSTTKNIDDKIINSPVSKLASIKANEPLAKFGSCECNLSPTDILFIATAWKVLIYPVLSNGILKL